MTEVRVDSTRYDIRVEAAAVGDRGSWQVVLDGTRIDFEKGRIRVALDGGEYSLLLVGTRADRPSACVSVRTQASLRRMLNGLNETND